ncbi:Transcription-repair-coupling factor [Methylacidimicrobium sp. AP8]|uniref:transcription-repair coupling factor n=1 Tax=Methylacidimicrobium sp. AP8 TaxID=2730359 RepID=UPI0018C17EB0|nr:transcription-repair coupling factor [Methylacidimicrobium sp. AP8]CAB4244595.1 Transcription-repair-coupling factor [Methylacidimicrobium sp. AP8]
MTQRTHPRERWFGAGPFDRWRKQLRPGRAYSLESIPTSAQAFVLSGLFRSSPPFLLILAASPKRAAALAAGLEAWGCPIPVFPESAPVPQGALPDLDVAASQLQIATLLLRRELPGLIATPGALRYRVPIPQALEKSILRLSPNNPPDRAELLDALAAAQFERCPRVDVRGQMSVRGSILDLFPWTAGRPLRTEWDGDTLVSLREFDPVSQRSLRTLSSTTISLLPPAEIAEGQASSLEEYLPDASCRFRIDAAAGEPAGDLLEPEPEFRDHDFLGMPTEDRLMREGRWTLFTAELRRWLAEEWDIGIFVNNEGEEKRLRELLAAEKIDTAAIAWLSGALTRGFSWPAARIAILSDSEIFGRYQVILHRPKEANHLTEVRPVETAPAEWQPGDFVVHLQHGIARYRGVEALPDEGGEALLLEFADAAKLYVPIDQSYLVSRYIGGTRRVPKLDTLGGTRWKKARAAAQGAIRDYAAKLLRIQAERQVLPGNASPPDSDWQREFEKSFVYRETPDQLRAIAQTKADMEAPRPMDRLICGDVGFGKTEVAIRAIFKAAVAGGQAALLAPTTVLAYQHYQTLRQRFADYPIQVVFLGRLASAAEERRALAAIASGECDVAVGTHRLLSPDVRFARLKLVVIDEEQRFGVHQKERWKERFRSVDMLALSATPIPRTLYLALAGARDLSLIETPPSNRLPIETIVCPYDERTIRSAIEKELARGGQVYFLHNRIASIERVCRRLRELVPTARIEIGHGRMDKEHLESVMQRFVSGEIDVFLATSIIENGLDIPNANTIIIDRADRFGLADLYQLRGRVGRSHQKAYAYLLLPRDRFLAADAKRRIRAMQEYSQLGAGFRIALRDLEIRGAGNLLGTAQSGHIAAIGFELYCRLLREAVAAVQGKKVRSPLACKVSIDFWENGVDRPGIPASYIPSIEERIAAHRQAAEAASLAERQELEKSWRDRFGPLPASVRLLLEEVELRILGGERSLERIEVQGDKLLLQRNGSYLMIGGRFPRLTGQDAESKLASAKKWILTLA